MILKSITLENFKAIGEEPVRIDFKPITLLFGPNSSGKSTIIQALHYAHEIFERANVDPRETITGGKAIDLGGFESMVHKHDLRLPIVLRFDVALNWENLPQYISDEMEDWVAHEIPLWDSLKEMGSAYVILTVRWNQLDSKPFVHAYEVGINNESVARISKTPGSKVAFIENLNLRHPLFVEEGSEKDEKIYVMEELAGEILSEKFISKTEAGLSTAIIPLALLDSALPSWEESLPIFGYKEHFPAEQSVRFGEVLSSIIVGIGQRIRDELDRFRYLGPLREIPSRNFRAITPFDDARWANGLAAWDILHSADEPFLADVSGWIGKKEHLGTGYTLSRKHYKEIEADYLSKLLAITEDTSIDKLEWVKDQLKEIQENLATRSRLFLLEEQRGIEVQPYDIGVGISQIVPVVVLALYSKDNLVAIEQPELHVHPAMQVSLADLFISQISTHPETVFLIETHSEHLMLRFLRRIRETNDNELPQDAVPLNPKQVAVNYIENASHGLRATNLRIDEAGEFIDHWPKGFFEERVKELF